MRATTKKNPATTGFAAAVNRRSLRTTRDLVHPSGGRRLRPIPASTRRCASIHLRLRTDRKSTRLNSSHSQISYAVFCLKKKKQTEDRESGLSERPLGQTIVGL